MKPHVKKLVEYVENKLDELANRKEMIAYHDTEMTWEELRHGVATSIAMDCRFSNDDLTRRDGTSYFHLYDVETKSGKEETISWIDMKQEWLEDSESFQEGKYHAEQTVDGKRIKMTVAPHPKIRDIVCFDLRSVGTNGGDHRGNVFSCKIGLLYGIIGKIIDPYTKNQKDKKAVTRYGAGYEMVVNVGGDSDPESTYTECINDRGIHCINRYDPQKGQSFVPEITYREAVIELVQSCESDELLREVFRKLSGL